MLSKLSLPSYKTGKATNPELSLATEIYEHFHKDINFPLLRRKIKENGITAVREDFYETIKGNFPHQKELFLKKILKINATKFSP